MARSSWFFGKKHPKFVVEKDRVLVPVGKTCSNSA